MESGLHMGHKGVDRLLETDGDGAWLWVGTVGWGLRAMAMGYEGSS